MISEDTGLVVRAWGKQFQAQSNRSKRKGKSIEDIFALPESVDLPSKLREQLRDKKSVSISDEELNQYISDQGIDNYDNILHKFVHNQYLHLEGDTLALRYLNKNQSKIHTFKPLWVTDTQRIQGIYPKNKEQKYVMDACLDDNIKFASLLGKAGTGKTLVALACGLHSVLETKKYEQLIVVRSTVPVGREIGFLPGSIEQKIDPHFGPIKDAMELILKRKNIIPGAKKKKKSPEEDIDTMDLDYFLEEGTIKFIPLTYLRGRSIPNAYIIFDEAQNLNSSITKTILTRPSATSKIIFNGDPYQIDEPYLDTENNGLTYATKRFLGQDLFSAVILKKGERSELAELAAKLL